MLSQRRGGVNDPLYHGRKLSISGCANRTRLSTAARAMRSGTVARADVRRRQRHCIAAGGAARPQSVRLRIDVAATTAIGSRRSIVRRREGARDGSPCGKVGKICGALCASFARAGGRQEKTRPAVLRSVDESEMLATLTSPARANDVVARDARRRVVERSDRRSFQAFTNAVIASVTAAAAAKIERMVAVVCMVRPFPFSSSVRPAARWCDKVTHGHAEKCKD